MSQAPPEYDLPDEDEFEELSEAFHSFFYEFFVDSMTIHRGETDFWYVPDFSKTELQLARALIRDNLQRKYVHLIEGAALLNDRHAVPLLKKMLDHENDLSLRLTIAGSLWKIAKDPLFVDGLQAMIETDDDALILAHADQIKWLGDM